MFFLWLKFAMIQVISILLENSQWQWLYLSWCLLLLVVLLQHDPHCSASGTPQLGTPVQPFQCLPHDIVTNLFCNSQVQAMQHSSHHHLNTELWTIEHRIWWEPLVLQRLKKFTRQVSSFLHGADCEQLWRQFLPYWLALRNQQSCTEFQVGKPTHTL